MNCKLEKDDDDDDDAWLMFARVHSGKSAALLEWQEN